RYVIDTGLARIAEYSPSQRVKRLPVKVISRSSADQRAGRAGRLERGIAIRLYSEDDYLKRQRFTPPEILRANLAEVILRMTALSIPDVTAFPFIDPPPKKSINDGFALLKELGAIRQEERRFILTDQGKQMANLPVDPRLSRMIIESADRGCLEEILVIAAVLSIQDPRERPLDKEQAASQFHRSRMNPASDFITFLNLWRQYNATWEGKESKGTLRKFCRENFLSYRRMQEWRDIYGQLKELAAEILPPEKMHPTILIGEALHRAVHTSILRGFLSSIALKKERNIYRAPKGKELSIFPGSGLFNRGGAWIVAADIFETSRLYARVTATIDSAWIEEAGEPFLVKSCLAPHWDSKRGEVVAIQSVSLFGLPIASDRRVSYGSIDPEEASKIFVRSALVEGDLLVSFPFLDHNRETIERVRLLEAKIRRPAILVEESILARFYEKRLPGVYDVRTLRKLIKERESDRFLHMTENDVIRSLPDDELHEYPDNITVSASTLPLTYRFMPGDNSDGVTVNIPTHLDPRIPIEEAELAMPGLLKEKVAFLLKGLPKEYRRAIVPIPETLAAFLEAKDRYEGVLVARLSSFLREKRGVRVPGTAWSLESLPQHLKVRYALIDATGGEISASRDFPAIRNNRAEIPEPAVLISAKKDWERENITRWDFGDLPESISLYSTPCDVRAFPSLDAQGDAAAIRLFATPSAAADAHRRGVRRLFELHLKDRLRELKRGLSIPPATEKLARLLGMTANIEEIIISKVLDENFPLTLRTQKEFLAAMDSAKERLYAAGRSLGDQLAAILDAWQETRLLFGRLTANKSATPTVHKFIEDLRKDLSVLVPADFFLQYGPDDREQLPRYLKALRVRAERGTHNLPKEQAKADLLEVLYKKFRKLSSTISAHTSPEKLHALKNLRWVFEEYKIALFAPEIKTLYPLSARRIEKILEDIEGMI
ncbi:MAG: ATP-dependent RNA helicase HrpA, partial [Deltaproteobacteria bacterium]|nr:ATP-dependent RNA helicase HrpA [Deltaproteobacteria bacterium]